MHFGSSMKDYGFLEEWLIKGEKKCFFSFSFKNKKNTTKVNDMHENGFRNSLTRLIVNHM